MSKRKDVEWKEVKKEFKLVSYNLGKGVNLLLYNLGKGINSLFENKEKNVANRKLATRSSKPNEGKK